LSRWGDKTSNNDNTFEVDGATRFPDENITFGDALKDDRPRWIAHGGSVIAVSYSHMSTMHRDILYIKMNLVSIGAHPVYINDYVISALPLSIKGER
jgi:hypothetical protein